MHRAARRLRPNESAVLEALREEAEPIAIPPKNLHAIPAAAAKDKELTGKWILGELRLYQSSESIEALAHVGHARVDAEALSRVIDLLVQR